MYNVLTKSFKTWHVKLGQVNNRSALIILLADFWEQIHYNYDSNGHQAGGLKLTKFVPEGLICQPRLFVFQAQATVERLSPAQRL